MAELAKSGSEASDVDNQAGGSRDPENAWMFLPPGMPSIEDPVREELKGKLGFYYKVNEFQEFQKELAAGRTIEELLNENPGLDMRLKEWRELGLIETPAAGSDPTMPPVGHLDRREAQSFPPEETDQ